MKPTTQKRVLLISPLPPPAGGIQTWTEVVKNEIQARADICFELVDTAVRWRHPADMRPMRRLAGGSAQALLDVARSIQAMRRFRPDCIHLNTSASYACAKDWLILLAAKRLGIRRVIQFHVGFLPEIAKENGRHWRLAAANFRLADKGLVLGEATGKFLSTYLPGVDLDAIPNPVKVPDALPSGAKSAGENRPFEFLFLGQVQEGKGVYDLVKAAALMDKNRFRLKMIGSIQPEMRRQLLDLAGADNGRWLNLVGEMPRAKCIEALQGADALVLPSIGAFEAFPYVILEAMSAGVPVISTDRGAIREILAVDQGDQPGGLIVEAGNPLSLREGMEKLMASRDWSRTLGENGYHRARKCYDAPVVVERLAKTWFPT